MKEVQVSIKALFFFILKHWKSVAVAMLVGACVLGGLQAISSTNVSVDVQPVAKPGDLLTESERTYVESIYDYLNELRALNTARRDSLVMNLDSDNLFKTELIYLVSVDDSENMEGIEQAYINFLNNSEFYGYVSNEVGLNTSDMKDVISISSPRSRHMAAKAVIKIAVISKDRVSAEDITKAINSYMSEKRDELFLMGYEHDLTELGISTYQGFDIDIQNLQLQYLQEIQSRNKTILDTENAIKDAQKEYYESLMNVSDAEDVTDDVVDPQAQTYVKISAKYIVLGLIAGAFVMCAMLFLIYVFANKLEEDDDIEGLFGIYFIGTITSKDYGKAIYKLKHLGKRTFDYDESVKLVSTKIKMTVQKDGVSTLGILGCGIKKYNEKINNDIIATLKKDGIEAVLIDDPIYDPASAEKLSEFERVVLLEKAGVTYRTEIGKELDMIKQLGIRAEGLIIVE